MESPTITLTNPNANQNPVADTTAADSARRAKVEELQRRRAARSDADATATPAVSAPSGSAPSGSAPRSSPRPRGGAAQGSKIAAAGFGLASMLGLVAAMGFASTSSAETPPAPAATVPPAQVVVVIHPADASAATAAVPGSPGVVAATPSQPIVLSAQPVVQQAPASQAPAGQTNGSR